MEYSSTGLSLTDISYNFIHIFPWRMWLGGTDIHYYQPFHSLQFCVLTSLLGQIVHKYLICYANVLVYPV